MPRVIKAILFDLDNTLYGASAGLQEVGDERITDWIVAHLGLAREEADALRVRTWREYGTTAKGLEAEYGLPTPDLYDYAISSIEPAQYLEPWPALDAMLARLSADCHVFTNSTDIYARKVLEALGVARHFERIFGIEYSGWVCKPNREVYEGLVRDLDLPAPQMVFVEDNPRNLAPAADMGMLTVLLDHAAIHTREHADLRIRSILDLADALASAGVSA